MANSEELIGTTTYVKLKEVSH